MKRQGSWFHASDIFDLRFVDEVPAVFVFLVFRLITALDKRELNSCFDENVMGKLMITMIGREVSLNGEVEQTREIMCVTLLQGRDEGSLELCSSWSAATFLSFKLSFYKPNRVLYCITIFKCSLKPHSYDFWSFAIIKIIPILSIKLNFEKFFVSIPEYIITN